MNQQQRPCKFGNRCNRINTCKFYHPKQQEQSNNNYYKGQQNGYQNKSYRKSRSKYHQNQYSSTQERANSQQKGLFRYEPQTRKYKNQFSQPQHQNWSYSTQQQQNYQHYRPKEFIDDFCWSFHMTDHCQKGIDCNQSHEFIINYPLRIKRLQFTQEISLIPKSKLVAEVDEQKIRYIIRGYDSIFVLQFSPNVNQLEPLEKIELDRNDENFFDYKCKTFLRSFTNTSTLEDFALNGHFVQNAHHSKITGIVPIDSSMFLTSSLDGSIKVWNLIENEIQNNLEQTQSLNQSFNPEKIKISILFMTKTEIQKISIILVGTNDSRLLIWIQDKDDPFTQVVLKSPEFSSKNKLNVYKAKIIGDDSLSKLVFIMAEDSEFHYIYRGQLKSQEYQLIYAEVNAYSNTKHTFEVYKNILFVSEISGIMIYRLPDHQNSLTQIGCILLQNLPTDIIVEQTQLKQTAVKFSTLAVLEPASQNNESKGHFSLYLIK